MYFHICPSRTPCVSRTLPVGIGKACPYPALAIRVNLSLRLVGYSAPENLGAYANYLQTRIKAYRDLKHDAVRVQSESNRDHRMSLEGDRDFGGSSGGGVSRSKTVVGRKLRVMSVEKGLLRETKIVQGVVDALVDTKVWGICPRRPLAFLIISCPSSTWTTSKKSST